MKREFLPMDDEAKSIILQENVRQYIKKLYQTALVISKETAALIAGFEMLNISITGIIACLKIEAGLFKWIWNARTYIHPMDIHEAKDVKSYIIYSVRPILDIIKNVYPKVQLLSNDYQISKKINVILLTMLMGNTSYDYCKTVNNGNQSEATYGYVCKQALPFAGLLLYLNHRDELLQFLINATIKSPLSNFT